MGYADTVSTVAEDPGPLKIGIYGEPGCGKTVFSCQAPRPLLLDYEKGRRSLLNHPELLTVKTRKIRSFAETEATIEAMLAKDPFFVEEVDTIVMDTITRCQRNHVIEEVKKNYAANSNRHKYLPSEAEFNLSNRVMERVILSFSDACDALDKTLVINCHVKEEKDGDSILIRPDTSPGLVPTMIGLLDAVFYMSSVTDSDGTTVRKLRTAAARKIKGKNRLGELPVELVDPTFQQILDAANKQREIALNAQG